MVAGTMNADVLALVFPFWLRAFVITLSMEIPIFVVLARIGMKRESCPVWRLAVAGAAGTLVTHPLLWFVWPHVISGYTLYIITGELLVATIESFTFFLIARPIHLSRAFLVSFIANGVSWGLGALLN
jgi:hypothetical protein